MKRLQQALRIEMRLLDVMANLVLCLLLAGVVVLLVAPHALGWRYGILQSGSMSPSMPAGAAILVVPAEPEEIRVGHVITYRSANNRDLLVTHRVAGITRESGSSLAFRTKGDANEEPDGGTVPAGRLMGRVAFSVPHVGTVADQLHSRTAFVLLLVVPAMLIVVFELRELATGVRALRRNGEDSVPPGSQGGSGVGSQA